MGSAWQMVQALIESVLPPQCVNCGAHVEGTRDLCSCCLRELDVLRAQPACPCCGAAPGPYLSPQGRCVSCRRRVVHFDGTVRVAAYDGVMRAVLRRFKYHGAEHLDAMLANLMGRALSEAPWRPRLEVLLAVPPHWSRRLIGGSYPAAALGRQLASQHGLPHPPLLRRCRFDNHQIGLSLADRTRNVRGAFVLRRGVRVRGAVLGVVDDVMTSGATLNEIAAVLKRAGAAAVFNVVLARAGRGDASLGAA